MKVAFIGDSYCAESTDKRSWSYIVAGMCNADIIADGLSGRALFHSYEVLLDVVNEADYIIFCITEPYRLPNKYGIDITPRSRWQAKRREYINLNKMAALIINKRVQVTLEQAISNYYNSIICFEWHEVAQKGLLMQIDELMLQKKKKCIWFPCFEDSMQGFIPKSGPLGNIPLYNISHNELISQGMTDEEIHQVILHDRRANHMDIRNNRNLAKVVIDTIKLSPEKIKMEEYFEV